MARTTVDTNGILPCQEAFLVDAPTPQASPRRWIQAKRPRGLTIHASSVCPGWNVGVL